MLVGLLFVVVAAVVVAGIVGVVNFVNFALNFVKNLGGASLATDLFVRIPTV